jgi:heme/copper-type cytochrome/quinol oxidase subunit 2
MKPLLFLANAFINTFGITQPSEAAAKRSAQFIAVLIGLVLIIFFCVAGIGIYILARH